MIQPDRVENTVRAIFSRPVEQTNDRIFDDQLEMMNSEEGRAIILRQAWIQILAWKRRYKHLSELAKVFDTLDIEHERFKKHNG